jgi:putative membrane protein
MCLGRARGGRDRGGSLAGWGGCLPLAAFVLLARPEVARAHSPFGGETQEQWVALGTAAVLGALWGAYVLGARRTPPRRLRAISFHSGVLLAFLALLGPLDEWAKTSTAMHMIQHMVLMVVIPPLWVLSQPIPQLVAGGGKVAAMSTTLVLRMARHPLWAAYAHGVVIWFWHVPYFYMLAVENPWWHAVEHACFLVSAGVFWWALLRFGRSNAAWSLLALLLTLMHTGFLGAVLSFARAPLYGEARDLQDQQLAGLIMWVLAAIPYLLASAWIGHRWLRQMEWQQLRSRIGVDR